MSNYTLRRTYLLNRFAWGMLGLALALSVFGGEYQSWPIIIGLVVLAALFWLIAGGIERKRRNKNKSLLDEKGNIKPNKL